MVELVSELEQAGDQTEGIMRKKIKQNLPFFIYF